MAMLAAGLLCLTSFSACDDDDDDDKTYGYQLSIELTEAGDIPAAEVTEINKAIKAGVEQFGTQYLTKSNAKKAFDLTVVAWQKTLSAAIKDNKETIKITLGYFNSGTQKMEFSHVFTFKPVA